MPVSITLRMHFSQFSDPDIIAGQLERLHDATPFNELTVMTYLEEHASGHPTLEVVRKWINHVLAYSRPLAERGVVLNVNPGHTVGQGDHGRTLLPTQRWTTMVGTDGRRSTFQVCPLDPNWQSYYRQVMHAYASPRRFRTIWLEDDIRFHNHAPLPWGGCFCERHVAAFNESYNLCATREEIVERCTQPGRPHEWRGLWMDMWQRTLLEQIASWRDVLKPYGCRLGLMSSEMGQHAAEGRRWSEWWRALENDPSKPVMHRPHFWDYPETTASGLADAVAKLDQNAAVQPSNIASEPEIETSMFGQWFRPLRQTVAEIQTAIVMGSTGLNLSLFDYIGNDPNTDVARIRMLQSWRPAFDWLADRCGARYAPTGVVCTWSESVGRLAPSLHRSEGGANPLSMTQGGGPGWKSLVHPTRGWAHWMGANGISFTCRTVDGVRALGGPSVWAFDEATLVEWLSGDVMIDAQAAEILIARGLGRYIGFASGRRITMDEVPFKYERLNDERFTRYKGAFIGQLFAENHGLLEVFQGQMVTGAHTVSELLDGDANLVGHGPVVFDNALGGRVAVTLRDVHQTKRFTLWDADQLQHLIRHVDRQKRIGSITATPHTLGLYLSDGREWRVAIWNASDDHCESIVLNRPASCPEFTQAWHVRENGVIESASIANDRITTNNAVRRWDMLFLER